MALQRNDMVEYFGEQLDGFCFSANGWVQSYGSRCVKLPIIFGDVSRREHTMFGWVKNPLPFFVELMKLPEIAPG